MQTFLAKMKKMPIISEEEKMGGLHAMFGPISEKLMEGLKPFYNSNFEKYVQEYINIVGQNMEKLCLQEEDENGEIKVHTIGKNELLGELKKEMAKRGRYSEADQKCMSSKTFSDLMSCNQLFKDLKVEKASGMHVGANTLLGSVSIKQSVFGGGNSNKSTPRGTAHDPNARSTFLKVERKKKQAEKKANQIADEMMK